MKNKVIFTALNLYIQGTKSYNGISYTRLENPHTSRAFGYGRTASNVPDTVLSYNSYDLRYKDYRKRTIRNLLQCVNLLEIEMDYMLTDSWIAFTSSLDRSEVLTKQGGIAKSMNDMQGAAPMTHPIIYKYIVSRKIKNYCTYNPDHSDFDNIRPVDDTLNKHAPYDASNNYYEDTL